MNGVGGLDAFIRESSTTENRGPLTVEAMEEQLRSLWNEVGAPQPTTLIMNYTTYETVRFFSQVGRVRGWFYRVFRAKMRRDLDRWLSDHPHPEAA